ncbi:exported hypothetical protein [Paraburkholderia piptadeniae]|uniref:Uncharacterized protein n=1 Tax=Paraburkholderia piptadeniae TaxID=1701573 RepID=A0A1N7S8U4_9BURK|nr:exported hypothetical protein [Paraburkholderia piptadeniae]
MSRWPSERRHKYAKTAPSALNSAHPTSAIAVVSIRNPIKKAARRRLQTKPLKSGVHAVGKPLPTVYDVSFDAYNKFRGNAHETGAERADESDERDWSRERPNY